MTHDGRIDAAAATQSLLSALDARPFDVILLWDGAEDGGCSVALEVFEGGGAAGASPRSRGQALGHVLELHAALADFLVLAAKERLCSEKPTVCETMDRYNCERLECSDGGGKGVPVSILSLNFDEAAIRDVDFHSDGHFQRCQATSIDSATFCAKKVNVSCVPVGGHIFLSLTFIHCDDPSLNEAFLAFSQRTLISDSALWKCEDRDGCSARRILYFLQQGLDGRVVVEGGLLAVVVPPSWGDVDDGEDIVLFRADSIKVQSASAEGADEASAGICPDQYGAASDCEKESETAVFRLGTKDQFSVVALNCITKPGTDKMITSVPLSISSASTDNFPHDLDGGQWGGCPGYELLAQELVAIANIDDQRAAPSAVLLTGCAGVGKSRLAQHVIRVVSGSSGEMSSIVKCISAKDILIAAASSSLEDLKEIILRAPDERSAGNTRATHESFQGMRPLLIIDDLDVFIDADSSGEELSSLHDSERLLSVNAIAGAIDDLVRFGSFGPRRRRNLQSGIHVPFILGLCGGNSTQLPPDLVRVGRMEKIIVMSPPTQFQREQMLRFLFRDLCASSPGHKKELGLTKLSPEDMAHRWAAACAPVTSGCVAADLRRICVDAVTRASSNVPHATSKQSDEHTNEVANERFPDNRYHFVVTWDDVREAARSCIPSQLAQLDVTMGNTYIQDIIPGHQLDYQKLHELSWQRFGGYDDVKARLYRTVVGPWRRRANLCPENTKQSPRLQGSTFLQIAPPSGVLFHGGPGVGKTLAAHCLASSLGLPVVKVRASDVLDQWLGGSEAAIRSLFQRARAASPSILFFDEIDALATNREDEDGSSNVHSRVLSTLLNEIDGVSIDAGRKDVLVIAATNRLKDIDAALLRPGRLEEHIYLRSPNSNDISAILNICLGSVPLGDGVVIEQLSDRLAKAGASGADVEGICNEACLHAVHQISDMDNPENILLSSSDFEAAIRQNGILGLANSLS